MTTPTDIQAAPLHERIATSMRALTVTDTLLLATIFTVTFTKLYWEPLGKLVLTQVLAMAFVAVFVAGRIATRNTRIPREVAIAACFMTAFAMAYMFGFFNLGTDVERVQFAKGMGQWLVRAGFLLCAAAHIADRGRQLFFQCLAAFLAGCCVNAAYGILQLIVLGTFQKNLDELVLTPLGFSVGGSRGIQFFGAGIYRINGLMRDTNHLGVMLAVPIAISLVWLRGLPRIAITSLLTAALLLSLSRSGWVAAAGALLVLALPLRQRLLSRNIVLPLIAFAIGLFAFTRVFPELTNSIILSRFDLSSGSSQTHVRLYSLIPDMLEQHPLFGLGLNTFAIHFEEISGRAEFGPHSYYVQLLTETGLVGFAIFVGWATWFLTMLLRVRDRARGGVMHPLALGIAAALVGTLFGNLFYLTAHIMYVDLLYAFGLAAPAVLGDALQSRPYARDHERPSPRVRQRPVTS